jgi:hypothetical protein
MPYKQLIIQVHRRADKSSAFPISPKGGLQHNQENLSWIDFKEVIRVWSSGGNIFYYYYYLVCEAIGTAATTGLLFEPRVIMKMIVEK